MQNRGSALASQRNMSVGRPHPLAGMTQIRQLKAVTVPAQMSLGKEVVEHRPIWLRESSCSPCPPVIRLMYSLQFLK